MARWRTWLALVAVLLIATAGVLLSWPSGPDERPSPPAPHPGDALRPDPNETVERARRQDDVESEPDAAEEADDSPGECRLLVVDEVTGAPVPEAEVRALDRSTWLVPPWAIIDDVLREGRELELDADASALLPEAYGDRVFVARAGSRVGAASLDSLETRELRLVLRAALAMQARALHADGSAAAGVDVALLYEGLVASARTAPVSGVATLYVAEESYRTFRQQWPDVALEAVFRLPLLGDRTAPFVEQPSGELVAEIQLPPVGSATCTVVDPDGAIVTTPYFIRLRRVDTAGSFFPQDRETSDGRAEFLHVGVGHALDLYAGWHGDGEAPHPAVTRRIAGPEAVGENVDVRIEVGHRWPDLLGRLLNPDGEPLPGEELQAVFLPPGGRRGVDRFVGGVPPTDRAGRFRLRLDRAPGPSEGAWLAIGLERFEDEFDVRVPLPEVLVAGDNDLGDIVVDGGDLLVSGSVVDVDGKALHDAWVRIDGGYGETRAWRAPSPPGKFAFRGDDRDGRLRLSVSHDGYLPSRVECAVGSSDLVVRLRRAAEARGSIRLPEHARADDFDVRLVAVPDERGQIDPAWDGLRGVGADLRSDGGFVADDVPPGPARLEVALEGDAAPRLTVEGLQLEAGKTTATQSIQDLAVGAFVRMVRVDVITARGVTRFPPRVRFRRGGAEGHWERRSRNRDGDRWIPVPAGESVDVAVTCAGFRPVVRAGVESDVRMRLEPAHQCVVRFALPEGVRAPSRAWVSEVTLEWLPGLSDSDGVADDAAFWPASLDEAGVASIVVPGPAKYRVRLELRPASSGYSLSRDVPLDAAGSVFTVGEDDESIEVTLPVDPDAYAEILRRDW